ncbi:hypothetical protein N7486_005534 [Penicillium sp. IBT 16267x]|nr:hypothetical protein N7486_005534 [Penicillium sp. IBT 16267x]
MTPPTTGSRKRQRVGPAEEFFDEVAESPSRLSGQLPNIQFDLLNEECSGDEGPSLVNLTGHDAEVAAQLQSTIPRQDEQQSHPPHGPWTRFKGGLDSMLRGTTHAPAATASTASAASYRDSVAG